MGEWYSPYIRVINEAREEVEMITLDSGFDDLVPEAESCWDDKTLYCDISNASAPPSVYETVKYMIMVAQKLCSYIDDFLATQSKDLSKEEAKGKRKDSAQLIKVEVFQRAFYVADVNILDETRINKLETLDHLHRLAKKFEQDKKERCKKEKYKFTRASWLGEKSAEDRKTINRRLKNLRENIIIKCLSGKIPDISANDIIEYKKNIGYRFNPDRVALDYIKDIFDKPTQ